MICTRNANVSFTCFCAINGLLLKELCFLLMFHMVKNVYIADIAANISNQDTWDLARLVGVCSHDQNKSFHFPIHSKMK